MTPRAWLILSITLAVLVAASVFIWHRPPPPANPLALHPDGIGPLRLGRAYEAAAADALDLSPATAFTGSGCFGLDEIRYSTELEGLPVTVMGMADTDRRLLIEIELSIDAPLQTEHETACLELRDRLLPFFVARFGAAGEYQVLAKPVSREHLVRTGPVVLVARWFPTGRSCYVSAHFGYQESVRQAPGL